MATNSVIYPHSLTRVSASHESPVTIAVGNDTLRYGTTTSLGSTLSAGQTLTISADIYVQTTGGAAVILTTPDPWDVEGETGTFTITDGGHTVTGADVVVMREAPLNITYDAYGGVGDGVTDNATALTAAKAALPSTGGEILYPPASGSYIHSSLPSFDDLGDVTLIGAGKYRGSSPGASQIEYTGTGDALSAKSTSGFHMEGIFLSGYNLGAGNILLKLDKGSGGDTNNFEIKNCWIRGTNNGNGVLVSLNKAIAGTIDGCFFHGGADQIRGVNALAQYSNTIRVRDSYFQYAASSAIRNPWQNWLIEGCAFEPLQSASGPAGAILVDAGYVPQATTVSSCSFQDGTVAGTWMDMRGSGLLVTGCMFDTGAKHVRWASATAVAIIGNYFEDAATANIELVSTPVNTRILGNHYTGPGTTISGSAGANSILDSPNLSTNHAGVLSGKTAGRLNVAGGINSAAGIVELYDRVSVSGAAAFDAFPDPGAGGAYLHGKAQINGALDHDGTTVGFFGVTPAVRASAYTPTNVSTDRSYDANATTTDELADVLGTLIADLKLYGLLQ